MAGRSERVPEIKSYDQVGKSEKENRDFCKNKRDIRLCIPGSIRWTEKMGRSKSSGKPLQIQQRTEEKRSGSLQYHFKSKKEIKSLQKIVKNSTQNALVDIIGNVTLSEKIKCFMKKIFNISSANILPEGNKE